MRKKTGAILLLLLVLSGSLLPGAQAVLQEGQVKVASGEYYDTEQHYFFYPTSELLDARLYASVANGMVVNNDVTLWVDAALTMQVYRDGVLLDMGDTNQVTQPGNYRVVILTNDGSSVTPLSFAIISPKSSNLSQYTLPNGFQLIGLYLNEEEAAINNIYEVEFEQEGLYRVVYQCTATGLTYEVSTVIDRTPPMLTLREVNEEGVAREAVDISDVEEDCTVYIQRDGVEIPYSSVLTDTGTYSISLTDAAGNATEYAFRIRVYLTVPAVLFILLILALAVALLAVLLRDRKNFRIR